MGLQWDTLFEFGVSPFELIVRGTLTYWFIFLLLRFAGRRNFGSMGMANILLVVLIADAAQNSMAAEYKSVGEGMVLIATLVFWSLFVDRLCYFVPSARVVLEPDRICLIKDGKMQRRCMRKEHVTEDELMAELRIKGIEDISEVRRAYLEGEGDVSVLTFAKK